jgi:hypothetical protein
MRLIETTAELGPSSGRTAIVSEASGPTKDAEFLYHARPSVTYATLSVG